MQSAPAVFSASDDSGWQTIFADVADLLRKGSPDTRRGPLARILSILKSHHCSSVLLEFPYRDEDFLSDYLHVHGRCFDDCGRDCIRLHFFTGDAVKPGNDPLARLLEFTRPGAFSTLGRCLGFMVVRPTGERCVGRTIIQYPFEDEPGQDIHVRARYRVNLYGVNLEVVGTPFMEQDAFGYACAGVALWALGYDLHQRYHTPRLFSSQIAEIARRQIPRSTVGHGLPAMQVAYVLRHLVLVLDHLPAHKTKSVEAYVQSTRGKLELHFLSTYAPDTNPDEFVWHPWKQNGTSKKPRRTNESLQDRVTADLSALQSDPPLVRSFVMAENVAYTIY